MLPVYNSKIVIIFFKEKEQELLEWPANCPDLNPIENLWAIMKQELRNQTALQENLEKCRNLIQSVIGALSENFGSRQQDIKKLKA